jgi:hypothetical protein
MRANRYLWHLPGSHRTSRNTMLANSLPPPRGMDTDEQHTRYGIGPMYGRILRQLQIRCDRRVRRVAGCLFFVADGRQPCGSAQVVGATTTHGSTAPRRSQPACRRDPGISSINIFFAEVMICHRVRIGPKYSRKRSRPSMVCSRIDVWSVAL